MKVTEITLEQFDFVDKLASYRIFGNWSPAIYEEKDNEGDVSGYGLRIIVGLSTTIRGDRSYKWDYFKTDATGLILTSPRGLGKPYNKKVRITDLPQAVIEYKDKHINE